MAEGEPKKRYTGWIILGVIVLFLLWGFGSYNSLVSIDTKVEQRWGNVQTSYQRRADLIPNLVAVVQQYSNYEGDLLKEVTKSRASIGSARTPAELQSAGNELNSALSRLLVVVENYPDLKANQNYLDLQVQLEGTENRINSERNYYNEDVREYKRKIRSFPTLILANMFGFEEGKWNIFQAEEGAQKSPDVKVLFET